MAQRWEQTQPTWWQFVFWALVAPVFAAGVLAAFTPLIIVTTPAVGLMIVAIAARGGCNASALGAVSGLGLGPLVFAWLNRRGPGAVCDRGGSTCTGESSPWPWLAAGLALITLGVVLYLATTRRARSTAAA